MTRNFSLTDEERAELIDLRDHPPLPYLRERAAALLNGDDGQPAARVVRQGLLRPRKLDTVYAWLERYLLDGTDGLRIRPGRGRKPTFPPWHASAVEAKEEIQRAHPGVRRRLGLHHPGAPDRAAMLNRWQRATASSA